MTDNALQIERVAILMRTGVEVWVTKEQSERILADIERNPGGRFIRVAGEVLNIKDISGIHTAEAIENRNRRRNGEWLCKVAGQWHGKGEKCKCLSEQSRKQVTENCQKHRAEYGFHMVNCQCNG